MGILFLVLAAVSLVVLVIGTVWFLVSHGTTRRRSGEDVGAEIMAGQMEDDEDGYTIQTTAFKGKGAMVEREASISLAEIKEMVRSGQGRQVLPALLALGGLAGLLLFGVVAFALLIGDPLIGILGLAVVLFTLARIVINFARA